MLVSELVVEAAAETRQKVAKMFELSTAFEKHWRRLCNSEFVSTVTETKSSSTEHMSWSLVSGCKTVEKC